MDARQSHSHNYFSYLKQRSTLGLIYRRFLLYPKLSKYLNGKLLDIGCGIGDMLAFRSNSIGVDVNQYNIDYCLSRGLEAHLIQDEAIDFHNEEFDSVLMDNVLEHIESPEQLLVEIKRVLKKGGVLLIGVPGAKGFASDSDHKVYYQESDLISLAARYDFKIDSFFYMPLFKSEFLNNRLRQYALYSIWIKR